MIAYFSVSFVFLFFGFKSYISLWSASGSLVPGDIYWYLTIVQTLSLFLPLVHFAKNGYVLPFRGKLSPAVIIYTFLMLNIAVVVALNYSLEGYVGGELETAIKYWAPLYVGHLSMFACGLYLDKLEKPIVKVLGITILFAMLIQIFLHVDYSSFRIDFSGGLSEKVVGTYLFLADSLAIIAFFVVCLFRSIYWKIVVYLLALAALFALNSRTSFILALAIFPLLLWKQKLDIKDFVVLLLAVFLVWVGFQGEITEKYREIAAENSRMMQILSGFEDDSSKNERDYLLELGLRDISDNPVTGKFGGQLEEGENWHDYIHGVLSYWRQFGGLAMLAIFFLILFSLGVWLKTWFGRYSEISHFYILTSVFFLGSSLFSRAYTFPELHLVFGLAIAQKMRLEFASKRNSRKRIVSRV